MSKKSDTKKNIVIVGGGFAGGELARQLSAKLDPAQYQLTLIDSRPYFVFLVATARMVVSGADKLEDHALMPFDKLFHNNNGTYKTGTVAEIHEEAPGKGGAVVLRDGESVPYDVLVLAPGMKWNGPIDFPDSDKEVREHLNSWHNKFAAAKHVVIAGGGAVGIELAGEIKDYFPKTQVTIVHSEEQLLNATYPDKFRRDLLRRLRRRGVNIIFGDSVDASPEPSTVGVTTRKGKAIPDADLIVPAFGARPNTAFIATLDPDALTERGFVKIAPTLEVKSHPGVFAIGDVLDWVEQKQAGKTPGHVAVVVANIVSFLAGTPELKTYAGSTEMILITNGKGGGAGYFDVLWGIMVGDFLSRLLKSKDLLVGKIAKNRGIV